MAIKEKTIITRYVFAVRDYLQLDKVEKRKCLTHSEELAINMLLGQEKVVLLTNTLQKGPSKPVHHFAK